jgi:hypothetical protein
MDGEILLCESRPAVSGKVKVTLLGEARFRKALAADPDTLPGWGLVHAALVREIFRAPALAIWNRLTKAGIELNPRLILNCSRLNMGELVELVAAKLEVGSKLAADQLDQALEGLFSVRQNRPSLRQLNSEEALAQAERLEGRQDQ